jgi:PAS domain S-box-containing protein
MRRVREGRRGTITARQVAERRVTPTREDALLRAICEISSDGIIVHDQGKIVMVNELVNTMFGYDVGELIGRSALDLVDSEYVDFVRANYESSMPLTYLVWGRRFDGTRFRAEVKARNLEYGEGSVRVAVVRDLSSLDAAAGERAENFSLLRATLDSTADGILVVDSTDHISLYNGRFIDLWRIKPEQLQGATDADVLRVVSDQIVDAQSFVARVQALYKAPETESVDSIELKDGRIIERYSRPQRIGDRIIGRAWSFRDVTAQRRAEQALELAVQMRDEFLGIASHELFTPITSLAVAVRGLAENEADATTKDMRDRLFRNAERQVARLARLVQELLDVTRIDGGRMGLEIDDVELEDVVKDVLERFAPELQRDKIEATLKVVSPARGHWDRTRLEQVVTNLVGNAIKFGRGRPIRIMVSDQDGRGELAVSDEGIGIPIDQQALIFERFQRAVSSRHFAGLGLGLYITRQIVQAHGGTLRLESTPGAGSTFTVRLPAWPPGEVQW